MKRLLIASLFLLGLFAIAAAGDYHYRTTLICSDCHVMHHSQQHGYNADGGGNFTAIGTEPQHMLLRDEVNKLCLNCHDGQSWAPDVYASNTQSNTREGGALNKTTDAGPYYPTGGHTLYSKATAPGGTWADTSEGLKCIDCHSGHGRTGSGFSSVGDTLLGEYRNLYPWPGTDATRLANVTYALGTNITTRDVFERSYAGVAAHYDFGTVDFNEPDQTKSGIGFWCQGCHTDFHGKQGDANMGGVGGEEWLRHPTADANIGALGGGHSSLTNFKNLLYRVKVMSSADDWGTQGTAWATAPADLTPTCISCHKGHGNKNSFGLIFAKGDAALGEEGDATGGNAQVRTLCKQCHIQGRYLP